MARTADYNAVALRPIRDVRPVHAPESVGGLVRFDYRTRDATACRDVEAILRCPFTDHSEVPLSRPCGSWTACATATNSPSRVHVGLHRLLERRGILLREFNLVGSTVPGERHGSIAGAAVQVIHENLCHDGLLGHDTY